MPEGKARNGSGLFYGITGFWAPTTGGRKFLKCNEESSEFKFAVGFSLTSRMPTLALHGFRQMLF